MIWIESTRPDFYCVACFYYIRLIKLMYFDTVGSRVVLYPIDKTVSICLAFFTFLIVVLVLDLESLTFFLTRMSLPFLG